MNIRLDEDGIPWIGKHLESLVQKVLATAPDSATPCAGGPRVVNLGLELLKPLLMLGIRRVSVTLMV